MWAAAGMSYAEVVDTLIRTAVDAPMTVLLSDDRIASIPAIESGEPLIDLFTRDVLTTGRQFARESVADRLAVADTFLPVGIRLHVVEGLRPVESQQAI